MNQIGNLQRQIDKLQKELDSLKSKKWKPWEPKINEDIQYISEDIKIDNARNYTAKSGDQNAFPEFINISDLPAKLKLFYKMYRIAKELNSLDGGWNADWNDDGRDKWGIQVSMSDFEINYYCINNFFIFGISVRSKEHVELLLNQFTQEELNAYNQ